MATTTNPTSISALMGDLSSVQQALSSTSGILALVQREAQLLSGQKASNTDLWPLRSPGKTERLVLAGDQKVEKAFHKTLQQGAFLETHIGSAMYAVMAKKLDYEEKIQHYLSLNRLAIDGQLSQMPRAVKYAADSVQFLETVRGYTDDIQILVQALQMNIALLRQVVAQMLGMIQNNMTALANLLQEICNWNLPPLPSMLMQIGALWHWNGFNFNSVAGFSFNPNLNFNFNFSFDQCGLRFPDLSAFFDGSVTQLSDGTLPVLISAPPLPADSTYAYPSQYSDPAYVSQMQSTVTAVYDPALARLPGTTSLPNPASIVSNYSLSPAAYAANVVSAVKELAPVVIQPGDSDYTASSLSPARETTLRSLMTRYVNLGQIVASGYDPNLTAAWLEALNLNRSGRAGNWLPNLQSVFTSAIQPSLDYLGETPVPWNAVLGGPGVSAAPAAIPLIAALKADTALNLHWQLSFIEASLLGYARNATWDAGADASFTAGFSGRDLDYVATPVPATPVDTTILGSGTAAYPVSCSYPQAIARAVASVVDMATTSIAGNPDYQSVHPQFRYVYDMFAEATLVDRFSQFWREFNANLRTLLQQDPYVVAFAVTYPKVLNSAVTPLADPSLYEALQSDAAARNRQWTPGSVLLPVPKALSSAVSTGAPSELTNGWSTGTFDPTAFLSRPDIQAQSLTAQIAMLRTNQSYASLATLSADLQLAVNSTIANAQAALESAGAPGWQVETDVETVVPPGNAGITVAFGQVDFDQASYVESPTSILIPAPGTYILSATFAWDPEGGSGTRKVTVLQNGSPVDSASVDGTSLNPFSLTYSGELAFAQGDVIEIRASHSLGSSQNLLSGSTFLGLRDIFTTAAPASGSGASSLTGTVGFFAGVDLAAFTAVAIGNDGNVHPVNPTVATPGTAPFMDGIALAAATAGASVSVLIGYGSIIEVPGQSWTVGGLVYVAADGSLTQDYASIISTCHWIVCAGRATTSTALLFAPHLPTNFTQNW